MGSWERRESEEEEAWEMQGGHWRWAKRKRKTRWLVRGRGGFIN